MTKISQLTDIGGSLAANDEFIIRDVSDASTPNKKVTSSGFIDYIIGQGVGSGFTQIAAGVGPLSRVRTISSGTTGTILFETANGGSIVEQARCDPAGRLLVGLTSANASGAKLQTSDGLTFPATQVASADPNTLDDYEEGTWTPVVSFGGASVGITGTFSGTYTKVGNVVTVGYRLTFTSKGTSTGTISISGLPFTTGGLDSISGFGYIHRLGTSVPAGQLSAALSGATFSFQFAGYIANTTSLADTDIRNDTDLRGGIVFRA